MNHMICQASKTLAIRLHRIGWELVAVEIDLDSEACRIELKSGDTHVLFDARSGAASITRELHERVQETVGRRGDRMPVTVIRPRLVGRLRCSGLRSGLRALSHYVADNSTTLLTHSEGRDLFRPLLSAS